MRVSWEEFKYYVLELKRQIEESGKQYKNILALPGGLTLAHSLGKLLGIPVTTEPSKATQNTLAVDAYMEGYNVPNLESYAGWRLDTAAIFYKKGRVEPTYYISKKNRPIKFPWDF